MADLTESVLEEGAQAIDAFGGNATKLAGVLAESFPAQSLDAVAASFAPSKECNAKVAALGKLVRDEAAVAVGLFRAAEMWLRVKAPAVSDGNNFGVDVQNYVLGELQGMRGAMEGMIISSRDYHWSRAQGLEKLFGEEKTEEAKGETTEKDGDKSTVKSSSSKKSSSSIPPGYADYQAYVVAIDVKQYHAAYTMLTDIKNNYLKAHVLFAKNMKRLSDPRGEGEDGRSANVMSMF